MRNIIASIIVTVVLWGAGCSRPTVEPTATSVPHNVPLYEALKLAAEQLKQGQLVEALETLVRIEPTVSETSSLSSLEYDYDEDYDCDNEFYLKDKALKALVEAFLEDRQSDNAVAAAQCIANKSLRNRSLYNILIRQCEAAVHNLDEFDLMIAKAENTATLLDNKHGLEYRDKGYGHLAQKYGEAGKFDRAVESLKKIESNKEYDYCLIGSEYSQSPGLMTLAFRSSVKTPEHEKRFQELVDLVREPSMKAKALLRQVDFYGLPTKTDLCKQKRLELVREAAEILRSLPGDWQKTHTTIQIYKCHLADGRKAETEIARQSIFDSILSIEPEDDLFNCYASQFYSFYPTDPSHPDRPMDADFTEKLHTLTAKTSNPETRADRWRCLLYVARRWVPPGNKERTLPFREGRQAALEVADPTRGAKMFLNLIELADKEELDSAFDDVIEHLLTPADEGKYENDNRCGLMQEVISLLAQKNCAERILEIVDSPRVPIEWKQELYVTAVDVLLNTHKTSEFRRDDIEKLFGRIQSPTKKYRLFERGNKERVAQLKIDETTEIEAALAIAKPEDRFKACAALANKLFEQKSDVDVRPLLDAMEKLVLTEKDIDRWYHNASTLTYWQVLHIASRFSLWDETKITDWLLRYEAAVLKIPNPGERYRCLRAMINITRPHSVDRQSEAVKNAMIDKLLAVARETDVRNPGERLNVLQLTAVQAHRENLPDRARSIIDEAIAFAESLPNEDRRRADGLIRQIEAYRDQYW